MTLDESLRALQRLIEIMDRLRSPGGCPWDAEQTPQSLVPYLLEEAHETIEAIEAGDPALICDELGDLLLQIVFHARIFAESGAFDIGDVAASIGDKLVRRHPHVFADAQLAGGDELIAQWERIKAKEKANEGKGAKPLLESIPPSLPALARTAKLIEKSARAGQEQPTPAEALSRCATAVQSLAHAADDQTIGEALFALVLVARAAGIDPEGALRRATHRHFAGDESP